MTVFFSAGSFLVTPVALATTLRGFLGAATSVTVATSLNFPAVGVAVIISAGGAVGLTFGIGFTLVFDTTAAFAAALACTYSRKNTFYFAKQIKGKGKGTV